MRTHCTFRLSALWASSLLASLLAPPLHGAQGRIEGQITNGTTRKPVPNQEIRLLQPRQGMQQVATASTDASGRFLFAQSAVDASSFYLLQTDFQGVHYPAPVQFGPDGTAAVNLTVYDSTRSDADIRVHTLRIVARAEGSIVRVEEEYALQNSSAPPRAYQSPDGTFRFRLSSSAGEPAVAVAGLMNMLLPQTPERGKAPGEFFIRYPLKPGVTPATVAYVADYAPHELLLRDRTPFPIDHAELVVFPASLSVDTPLMKAAGLDATSNVKTFEAENLPRGAPLEFRLSGEPAASSPAEAVQPGDEVKIGPNTMTRLSVPLLVCFLLVLLWALGVRVAKEWPEWKTRHAASPAQKELTAKVDQLLNSLADLDELFASGKIAESKYWKERLELKARVVAMLKKAPSSLLESYATRHAAR